MAYRYDGGCARRRRLCVEKEGYDKFCSELGKMVPVKDSGPLEWYSGCFYEKERVGSLDHLAGELRSRVGGGVWYRVSRLLPVLQRDLESLMLTTSMC